MTATGDEVWGDFLLTRPPVRVPPLGEMGPFLARARSTRDRLHERIEEARLQYGRTPEGSLRRCLGAMAAQCCVMIRQSERIGISPSCASDLFGSAWAIADSHCVTFGRFPEMARDHVNRTPCGRIPPEGYASEVERAARTISEFVAALPDADESSALSSLACLGGSLLRAACLGPECEGI